MKKRILLKRWLSRLYEDHVDDVIEERQVVLDEKKIVVLDEKKSQTLRGIFFQLSWQKISRWCRKKSNISSSIFCPTRSPRERAYYRYLSKVTAINDKHTHTHTRTTCATTPAVVELILLKFACIIIKGAISRLPNLAISRLVDIAAAAVVDVSSGFYLQTVFAPAPDTRRRE